MTLEITPGTLRNEGPGFIPQTHFKGFIETTDVVNFGPEQFERDTNNAIHFIFSATDPPATNSRSRSLLWYRRGDGRMYAWDNAWQDTNASLSVGLWVAVSDRKDLVVRRTDGNTWPNDDGYHHSPFSLYMPQGHSSCNTNETNQHGGVPRFVPHVSQTGLMRWNKFFVLDTNASMAYSDEDFQVMTELGYCWAGIHTNSSGPGFAWFIASAVTDPLFPSKLIHSLDPNSEAGANRWWPYRAHSNAYMIGYVVGSGPASEYSAALDTSRMQIFLNSEVARLHLS
jgi:hypothetical protein